MKNNLFKTIGTILVTCPKKISHLLEKEITDLGFSVKQTFATAVQLDGTVTDCIKLNLHLRTGHRVLYLIHQFKAKGPDQLYKELNKLEWENLINPDGYFSVVSHVENETINNSTFASLRCKDAIVDRIQSVKNKRPDSGPDKSKTVLFLHWMNEEALLYYDTSGETIAKHGYRKMPHSAPLQETLAAALILSSQWDKTSPFVNPMCGSGTLAIEAALIACNRKPGLYRSNYGFMHIPGYSLEDYVKLRAEMKSEIIKNDVKIIASDISQIAIEAAKVNAMTAGVEHMIEFLVCDFNETPLPPDKGGVVIFNPEYGERLGKEETLVETYKQIGDFFKQKCKGYTGYIFTGNAQLAKSIGLKTKRRMEFYNSTIECRLLEYELYEGTRKQKINIEGEI